MKFAVVILAVVAAASAQFNQKYYDPFQRPTPAPYKPYRNSFVTVQPTYAPIVYTTPAPVPVAYVKYSNQDARTAQIVRYENEINPDGSYRYAVQTDNGIAAEAQGVPRNFGGNPPVVPDVAQGSFSWTAPDGKVISITYVADENGYQPSGDAIPQPPPVPPQIARALEYISRNTVKK